MKEYIDARGHRTTVEEDLEEVLTICIEDDDRELRTVIERIKMKEGPEVTDRQVIEEALRWYEANLMAEWK